MSLSHPSSLCRLARRPARLALGGLAAVYLAACLLPSEPPEVELIQFRLDFETPLRVPVHGTVFPAIPIHKDGQPLEPAPAYRLVVEDQDVVRVDETGQGLVGVARGSRSVRAVVATPIGERDTVFPVQVVVSRVHVVNQDTGSTRFGNQAALTRVGQTHQFRAIARDAQGQEVPDVPFAWFTDDSLVARILAPGTVEAVDEGSTKVWAEADGVRGPGFVTVAQAAAAVQLAPELDTLRTVGRSVGYLALVLDSANRAISGAKPRWSSSDTNVARVSPLGVATATGAGSARIIARVGAAADTATLVVAQVARFLFVSPGLQTLTAVGDTARFTTETMDSSGAPMVGPSVAWSVDDTSVATVDPSGLATARRNGSVIVTAAADRLSASGTVAVRQEMARFRLLEDGLALNGEGSTGRLHVEGLDRNGYPLPSTDPTVFAWRAQLGVVATVDSTGLVTAHGDGATWIAASAGTMGDTAMVTVSGAPQALIAFTSGSGIEVVRRDGTGRWVLLPEAGGPAWSPDGARLAFEWSGNGRPDIYAAAADGSDTVNLTNHFSSNRHAAWSPDGSRLAFWSDRLLGGGIFVMNADGSGVTLVRGAVEVNGTLFSPDHPTWSPEGTRIAFDQDCNVHVVNADGGGLLTLTNSPEDRCSHSPAWSPDGSQLAFVSNRAAIGDDAWLRYDLWLMAPDGSGAVNLIPGFTAVRPSYGFPPAWSPGGSQLVFDAGELTTCNDYYYGPYPCLGPSHLWVVSRDGTAITQITDGNGEGRPSWRPAVPFVARSGARP